MSSKNRATRWGVFLATCAGLVLIAGCGKNRVTVDVDVTSFIDPSDLQSDYSTQGIVPPDHLIVDSPPIEVMLLEGAQDFIHAEEMSIDVGIEYDTQTGDGLASFTVYFAADQAGLFNTAPVTTVPATLVSGSVTHSTATFEADARLLDLFTRERIWMGLRFNYDPASSQPLEGIYTITSLMAHVVSTIEIF